MKLQNLNNKIFLEIDSINPCNPSPCGPYSVCRMSSNVAICSCLDGYVGSAPACRPECLTDNDCSSERTCINEKCVSPCSICAYNADCSVIRHKPICSCPEEMSGNPYSYCWPKPYIKQEDDVCNPSPCGLFSTCTNNNNVPECKCLENYIGRPPNCRPECTSDFDCISTQHCRNQKCENLCSEGICGENAECLAKFHRVSCLCLPGYTGSPYIQCTKPRSEVSFLTPCEKYPCGMNAKCLNINGREHCVCLENYFGNPYVQCNPECMLNSDCSNNMVCIQQKCQDPCIGLCASNALCFVRDHIPRCTCQPDFDGNPYELCYPKRQSKVYN